MEGGVRMAMEMLLVQAIATGLQLLSKVILGQGAFVFALMTYRNIVAAFCVAPFAFFLERDSLKKLSFSAVIWIFFVALSGITMAMGFFYFGLQNTSATYATNFLNLIPIVTFVFSIITRVEKLRLKTKAGNIILIGIMSCLAGALTITLYKGKTFHLSTININNHAIAPTVKPNWGLGTIFLACSCISYGFWFIIQAKLFKIFPYKYCATTLICIFATFQSMVVGLFIDRTKASWKLGWNLQLVTILYSGALATAATFCLISSAVAQRGPTYPSIFNPLSLILVAIAESALLGSSISVGSLIGMTLIIVGLYLFLWGKNLEIKSLIISNMRKTEAQVTAVGTNSLQSTAVVVPTSSPNERHIHIDFADEEEEMTKPK
ncbi:unnamed protein product [Cuscuta epithymum]|uniref:WAT1-related protein n=1 Tax=Cuscuta epithymum TaxID=186058 RepID=A0AAV0FMF7_9ASTE|nr:unnamed protein product [Cuscuta epithymum]CAH9136873.1 unnamed protein product [Cuscuta epithymum]